MTTADDEPRTAFVIHRTVEVGLGLVKTACGGAFDDYNAGPVTCLACLSIDNCKCGNVSKPPHPCPYALDIVHNHGPCNCCDDCEIACYYDT